MYHLVFYDDELEYLEQIRRQAAELCGDLGYEAKISVCGSEKEIWEELAKENEGILVLFLDICIREERKGGIELAEEINRRYPGSIIVFLTGYLDYASDVYETEHCYYILKEDLERRLPVFFERILPERLAGERETLLLGIGSRMEQVPQKHILCLERNLRKTRILLEDGRSLECYEKLESLEKRLGPGDFIRCHNSFLVSCRHIREMRRTEIKLSDGTLVPVSRQYSAETRKAFARWGTRKLF